MTDDMRPVSVLFLCTGNSARSIMAEATLNALGAPRIRAFSAGSHPTGTVSPLALELLQKSRIPIEGLRSKSWDEYARPGAPSLDIVITVCDSAAGEVCPIWPGRPITAHWGVEDPATVTGSDDDRRRAFFHAYDRLRNRIEQFVGLPLAELDRPALSQRLKEIGRS